MKMKTQRLPFTTTSVILAATLALLPGCASNGTLTPQGQSALAAMADVAIGAAAAHFGVSPNDAQAVTTAANSLFGIAAQAQANLGQTPASANIAQGASTPAIGAAVQAALPNAPLTQTTVNSLFAAASKTGSGIVP